MAELGWFRGLITILTLGAFLGICWWAYRPSNRSRFERDAWLAFDDAEIPGGISREVVISSKPSEDPS